MSSYSVYDSYPDSELKKVINNYYDQVDIVRVTQKKIREIELNPKKSKSDEQKIQALRNQLKNDKQDLITWDSDAHVAELILKKRNDIKDILEIENHLRDTVEYDYTRYREFKERDLSKAIKATKEEEEKKKKYHKYSKIKIPLKEYSIIQPYPPGIQLVKQEKEKEKEKEEQMNLYEMNKEQLMQVMLKQYITIDEFLVLQNKIRRQDDIYSGKINGFVKPEDRKQSLEEIEILSPKYIEAKRIYDVCNNMIREIESHLNKSVPTEIQSQTQIGTFEEETEPETLIKKDTHIEEKKQTETQTEKNAKTQTEKNTETQTEKNVMDLTPFDIEKLKELIKKYPELKDGITTILLSQLIKRGTVDRKDIDDIKRFIPEKSYIEKSYTFLKPNEKTIIKSNLKYNVISLPTVNKTYTYFD